MNSEKRDRSILLHISDYCLEIEETMADISNSKAKYDESRIHRNALAMCVLQIGELVSVLSDDFKDAYTEIPWRDIKAMRNIVAHHYGNFDFNALWEVAQDDIPALKDFCVRSLEGWSKEN